MKKNILVYKAEENSSLAEVIKKNVSKRFYKHLKFIEAEFWIRGEQKKLFEKVNAGEEIEVHYIEKTKENKWPISLKTPRIIFENEHYAIIDKEPNLLTIPIQANPTSLYQQLVAYFKSTDIHILNRLDRETSGLLVVAKDRYSASLLEPPHQHIVRKYLCLVEGILEQGGRIENYIAKCLDSNKRYVSSSKEGKLAISHYWVVKAFEDTTLLEFQLETGRTHQIRVHASSIGHPIVGDKLYGSKADGNLCLTSYYVEFEDPYTKEKISRRIKEAW